jgi:hypothetical protein
MSISIEVVDIDAAAVILIVVVTVCSVVLDVFVVGVFLFVDVSLLRFTYVMCKLYVGTRMTVDVLCVRYVWIAFKHRDICLNVCLLE